MASITYYVALPFMRDESGEMIAGNAEECQSATTALRRAELMSRIPGSIGAVAFSRTGDPMIGEFGDAHLLREVLEGQTADHVALAIGPEGGWTDQEFLAAGKAGYREASLGDLILRTETAVTACLGAVNYALGS